MKTVTCVVAMALLCLVAACAPAAPAPTRVPEPTATLAEVRAAKVEHLAGLWFDGDSYIRAGEDGTWKAAQSIEGLDNPDWLMEGTWWFEDGVCYEENPMCQGVFVYDAYLRIEEGRAVRIAMTVIEVPDQPCSELTLGTQRVLVRVDREG
jgi:hypothetical protein